MKILTNILFLLLIPISIYAFDAKQKPNIVFIFVDDQGYYDLAC